jgi:hypothetical protein
MKDYTKQQLESIKEHATHLSNNCGECETCTREFGTAVPYDPEETYTLILMIERRNRIIDKLYKELHYLGSKVD